MAELEGKQKRKAATPPEGYVCTICKIPGHWIQKCPKKRKKTNPNHVYTPGVDPSQADIEKARELQKIKPPNCSCGVPSRLRKVKRSHSAGDQSRAIGKYFFFCSKRKDDTTKCRFAKLVDDVIKPKGDTICSFFAKRGYCMRGDRCLYKHVKKGSNTSEFKKKEDCNSITKNKSDENKNTKDDETDDSSSSSSDSDDSSSSDSDDSSSSDSDDSSSSDSDS